MAIPGRKQDSGFIIKEADNRVSTIVFSNDGESVDSLLRRFNRKVMQDGVLSEARRRARFQKPLTRRTRKQVAARRQATKAARASARTSK
jgi:small subunit ribosomal protein S21